MYYIDLKLKNSQIMSTGKRLAKRSIVGTKVCAPGLDGKYYAGVIQAVKTPAPFAEATSCIRLTPDTRYTVRFDARQGPMARASAEFTEADLVGPGFRTVADVALADGQRVYVTYNGREVAGELRAAPGPGDDEVRILIAPPGIEEPLTVTKKIEDIRLLESRKSPRLADQDTDFARLADMAGDRKRAASNTIDVPLPSHHHINRKRTSSFSQDPVPSPTTTTMDECNAAMVLLYLSTSPPYPHELSPGSSSSSSSRSTPSPPSLHEHQYMDSSPDEGVFMDYAEMPKRKKKYATLGFRCTYRGCQQRETIKEAIRAHVRDVHGKGPDEEYFYYDDVKEDDEPATIIPCPQQQTQAQAHHLQQAHQLQQQTQQPQAAQPTLSHFDLTRPPHEDPEYQRQLVGTLRQKMMCSAASSAPTTFFSPGAALKTAASSPRRARGDSKKCRKVYGMDHKDQWCTQCKWKKACTRFID